jgi:hypothetical protein
MMLSGLTGEEEDDLRRSPSPGRTGCKRVRNSCSIAGC